MLKCFNIFSPSLQGLCVVVVDRARRKKGGDAGLQKAGAQRYTSSL